MAVLHDAALYKKRRQDLIRIVLQEHEDVSTGAIVVVANFEGHEFFEQERSFYYLTGLEEPGAILVLGFDGLQTLYIPHYKDGRDGWVKSPVEVTCERAHELGFDRIEFLGEQSLQFQMHQFVSQELYENLISYLGTLCAHDGIIFSTIPNTAAGYEQQRLFLMHLVSWVPDLHGALRDCSAAIAQLRQKKATIEIEKIYKAIEITALAQEAAAQAIMQGVTESEVQAALEYIITGSHAQRAFPSVIGSGPNSTVLHYTQQENRTLKNGDLVVVDIGASYKNYAADITRTYPVSGVFTERQKEIYTIVLELQEHIAAIAKPGMYLRSTKHQERSLHHIAMNFLKERGYDKYMPHGLGHYMGLDVHDVGDYNIPLAPGDVFTIEPGIYIKEESLGIRIEDDYWMTEDGAVCLSEHIPKAIDEIEKMVQQKFK